MFRHEHLIFIIRLLSLAWTVQAGTVAFGISKKIGGPTPKPDDGMYDGEWQAGFGALGGLDWI